MKYITLTFATFFSLITYSQFGEVHPISATFSDPQILANFDIDGDTDMDILVFSKFAKTIAWSENNGSGSFSSPVTLLTNVSDPNDI